MITALEVIEKTPLVITADDGGTIKIWDIRSLKCFQSVECGYKTVISKLMNLYSEGMLSFVGRRVNIMEFDDKSKIVKKF